MTVLTDHLPLLVGAPNGIKKLRELILELGVRGKLVPQDPGDEPASELLKRIAKEKARLVAAGKIKEQKSIPGIEGVESFLLPDGWVWIRIAELAVIRGGCTPSMAKPEFWDGTIPWVSPKDMHAGAITDSELKVSQLALDNSSLELVPVGSVLIVGRSGILKRKLPTQITAVACTINQDLKAVSPYEHVESRYLQLMMQGTERLILSEDVKQGTTVQSIVYERLFSRQFGFPPLAEQHRIVAKADELMALCDTLESQQTNAESAHAQLVQALLDSLTQASDADDFAASWQRLSQHFDTLFTTEASIDALKQTLLQLAVMGKLVPQDSDDEPASELLDRIVKERKRLTNDEGLRTNAREDVPDEEHEFVLNSGWTIYRLGNLARFIDYRGRTPTKTTSGVPLITAKNVRPGFISREPQEFIAEPDYAGWMTRGFPRVGDMLFTTEAPLGNVSLIDISERFALAQRVICLQLHEPLTGPFLRLVMMSSIFQLQLTDAATGMTATGIKSARLKELPVPIPPLAEQHRIVAKVDELTSLCDQLKSRIRQVRVLKEQLASTLVERAVA